jgi:hypothetical protein
MDQKQYAAGLTGNIIGPVLYTKTEKWAVMYMYFGV